MASRRLFGRVHNSCSKIVHRSPKHHLNSRVPLLGVKAQDEKDSRNHGLQDPYVCVSL